MVHKREKPLYSIIVASFNYADLTAEAIKSLLAQTYSRLEVIVVDDGSTDNSLDIVKGLCEKDKRVKLYTHPDNANHGLCETVLLGLSKAKGDFVAFCESDDKWDEKHLEELTRFINSYKDVAFVHNKIKFFGSPESNPKLVKFVTQQQKNYFHTGYNRINIHKNPTRNRVATFSSVAIRADVLRSLNFDSPVPSHLDFWLYRQILAKHPMFYCNKAVTFWRIHPNSFCSIDLEERQDGLTSDLELLVKQSDKMIDKQ